MRKSLAALAFVFALAFTFGAAGTAPATAAGGGGGNCYYKCSCTGAPLRCCVTSTGGEACKPTDVIQCPHIITC